LSHFNYLELELVQRSNILLELEAENKASIESTVANRDAL
jgi:hypothetical protein